MVDKIRLGKKIYKNKAEVLFIARHPSNFYEIRNGYEEHVHGEYLRYIKKYGGFFYSIGKKSLFASDLKLKIKFASSFKFAYWLIWRSINNKSKFVIVFAYPSALSLSHLLPFFFFIKMLWGIKFVTSVHDLYIEQYQAFTGKSPKILYIPVRIIDYLFLRFLSDSVITVSPSYLYYISSLYKIKPSKMRFFSNSSFPKFFKPLKDFPETFTILYAGSLMLGKGLLDFINVLRLLRTDMDFNLVLLGEQFFPIPKESWIHTDHVPFAKIPELYAATTVCVIPFPKVLHYNYTRPIKLFDYMASGRPIISLNLFETASIINTYQCGIVVEDYNGVCKVLKQLYFNPLLVKTMGTNARKAVEEVFNWNNVVIKLRLLIVELSM